VSKLDTRFSAKNSHPTPFIPLYVVYTAGDPIKMATAVSPKRSFLLLFQMAYVRKMKTTGAKESASAGLRYVISDKHSAMKTPIRMNPS